MNFTSPWNLLLLLLIPLFLWVAWSRRNPYNRWRDHNRWRETASLIMRSIIVLLVVLALAGISQVRESDKLATVFLLDVSDSVGLAGREAGVSYIQAAMATMAPDDAAGVILFGRDALVERAVSPQVTLRELSSVPISSHTDIAGAIRLGLTLYPEDAARRMVILSDGAATQGDARQAAQLAQANGVEISVVSLAPSVGPEVRLDNLQAPTLLHEGETFDVSVDLHSNIPTEVPLQIFSEGQLVAQQNLSLQPGSNSFILPLVAGESGFTTFQAHINAEDDTFLQNNTLDAFSEVTGPLSVLLVANQADEGKPVAEALRGAGLVVTEIGPAQLPSDLGSLSGFETIVLINVPAFKLAPRQLTLLQTYVRDLGHGLVVIGGEESYGVGGYYQTPLEETLPVDMVIQDKERLPGMTMLMVIDKSGSMQASGTDQFGWGIPRKVELAKEAIYRSLDLLVPWDRVGVIAFDNRARWVVEPVAAGDIEAIKGAVGTIRASGGTDILAGLQLAAQAIEKEATQIRHIVLLTDGGADPNGIPELVESLAEKGVTLSVVAIGEDYAPFLEEVAELAGGRFHFASDPTVIPQIFAQETSLASRSYLVEETFVPEVVSPSPILQGLNQTPQLQGYVATSPKLTAQLILQGGSEEDPLLAQWQYGLGRSVAWTSDAKGQWAIDWINWPDFPRFWSQAVRWTIVAGSGGALESQVRVVDGRAIVTAEVLQADGDYQNNLDVTLSLIDPELNQQTLTLPQVAPGLYQTEFQPDQTGTYLLHVVGQADDELVAAQTRGFVMTYSPEYRFDQIDETLLPNITTIGGGQMLPLDTPAEVFEHTLPPVQSNTPLWPWFLIAAVILLPVDVGLRRIIFGRAEIRQIWRRVQKYFPQSQLVVQPEIQPSRASQLLKVKERPQSPQQVSPRDLKPMADVPPTPSEETPGDSAPSMAKTDTPSLPEKLGTVRQLMKAKQRRRNRE